VSINNILKKSFRLRLFTYLLPGLTLTLTTQIHPAFAAKFANQFVEFELPPQWQCNLEGAEWVCQSMSEDKKRDAIIVLAAKLKGDQDSLDQYLNYLKSSKNYTSVQGKTITSESKYAKTVDIDNHAWVDSLHSDSEIPGFFTRYLATIKQDIGVLVTYSINKTKYQQYIQDFETLVKTLKVFRKPGGLNPMPGSNSNLFQTAQVPTQMSQETVFPDSTPQPGADTPQKKKKDDGDILPLLAIAGAIGFIIWRKRRNSRE